MQDGEWNLNVTRSDAIDIARRAERLLPTHLTGLTTLVTDSFAATPPAVELVLN